MTKAATTPMLLSGYADNLEQLSPAELTHMFETAERHCKFFPTVAELYELVAVEDNPDTAAVRREQAIRERHEAAARARRGQK